jgi:hypothetical protein
MKTNFKFLALIFATTLISTPKVQSKITLDGCATKLSIVVSIAGPIAIAHYLNGSVNDKENTEKLFYSIVETLISLPTSYCLYKKTENNTFLTSINGIYAFLCLNSAIQEYNKHCQAQSSWTAWVPFTDKQKDKNKATVNILNFLYYALMAYQLNK